MSRRTLLVFGASALVLLLFTLILLSAPESLQDGKVFRSGLLSNQVHFAEFSNQSVDRGILAWSLAGHWETPRAKLSWHAKEIWRQRHLIDLQRLRASARHAGGRCGVVLLGDSITEGWQRPYFSEKFPEVDSCAAGGCGAGSSFLKDFGADVLTFAIGGDKVQDLGWRLFEDGGAAALNECKPEVLLLLIGTNDLRADQSVYPVLQQLQTLVDQLQNALHTGLGGQAGRHGTQLFVQAILPRAVPHRCDADPIFSAAWDASNSEFTMVSQVNRALREWSTNRSIAFLDCGPALLENGRLTRKIFPDFLHLSAEGYAVWRTCLLEHLKNAGWKRPSASLASSANSGDVLVPNRKYLAQPGNQNAIEILWQRPAGASQILAVVLLLHGCHHSATDWWPKGSCSNCIGLPQEMKVTRTVLARGFVAVAISSSNRISKCWTPYADLSRLEAGVSFVYDKEALAMDVPLYAFGVSSGGAMLASLVQSAVMGPRLRCRISEVMAIPAPPQPHGRRQSGPGPSTLFIHMPRDAATAERVNRSLMSHWSLKMTAAELHCHAVRISGDWFASWISGMTSTQSKALVKKLRDAGVLHQDGSLRGDPQLSDQWRQALLETCVPQSLGDTLQPYVPSTSALAELMYYAWAFHEICATFAEVMLDFCVDPRGTCKRNGWKCGTGNM